MGCHARDNGEQPVHESLVLPARNGRSVDLVGLGETTPSVGTRTNLRDATRTSVIAALVGVKEGPDVTEAWLSACGPSSS